MSGFNHVVTPSPSPQPTFPPLPAAAKWAKLTPSQWNNMSAVGRRNVVRGYENYKFKSGQTTITNPFPGAVPDKNGSYNINYQQYLTAQEKYNGTHNNKPAVQSKPPVVPSTNPYKGPFKFNAPMVNNAYFNPLAGLKADGLYGYVDNLSYTDVAQAWRDGKGAKGAFQMDRSLNTAANLATAQKALAAQNSPTQVDPTMYGFRFMYNPTTIDMAWGAIMSANPQYESLNLDVVNPITANLMNSTISFDILVNRIEDMNYLQNDGHYYIPNDPTSQAFGNLYNAENALYAALGGTGSLPGEPNNPYPSTVPIEDRKAIYEKGTMYDIEYLFKALHGFDGQSLVQTSLMGTTSDPGWLPVIPVELHLGNSMRYRVRVSSLSVHHSVFNVRMVPILSTITVTCNRYYDYKTADYNAKKK